VELAARSGKTLRDVGFDPSGHLIVTASEDRTARVWDVRSGRLLHVLRHGDGNDEWVESAQFSRDGRLVLTAGDDGTAKVWDAVSGERLAILGQPGGPPLYDAALSPDGRIVAAGGGGPVLRLWRWREPKLMLRLRGFATRVDGVAFSPAGDLVAAAGDRTIRIWRADDGTPVAVLPRRDRRDQLTSVAFDPSGELLAAGGSSGAAEIWEVSTKQRLARVTRHGDSVAAVGFSADGRYLVTAGHDGIANVWAIPGASLVTSVRTRSPSLEAAAFADGRIMAVAGAEGRATILECAECRPLEALICLAASRVTPRVRARERDAFASCD
jgi:WD40 repeat protein